MKGRNMKHKLTIPALFAAVAMIAGEIHIDPAGTLRNEKDEPQFLCGAVCGHHAYAGVTRFSKKFRGTYPEEFRWIYETLPDKAYWLRLGFNSVITNNDSYVLRVFFPDYKENLNTDPWKHYDSGVKKYGLKRSRAHWSEEPVLQTKAAIRTYRGFPFFADCFIPVGRNRQDDAKLLPKEARVKDRFAFHQRNIPFQLGSPEGRDALFKMYSYMVKSYTELGVSPLGYRVITENRFQDYSDGNRKRFAERLQKKFGSVEAMNKAWKTSYAGFGDAAKLSENKEFYSIPAGIEYLKMEQEQAMKAYADLHKLIKTLNPKSYGAIIQTLGRHMYRTNSSNLNLFRMNQALDMVSSGTGNYTFTLENVDDDILFKDAPSISEDLRESLIRDAFYRAIAKNKPLLNLEVYGVGSHYTAQAFNSVLWRELATGHSAALFHAWSGLLGQDPNNKHPISFLLQNPNAVPPGELAGIRKMLEESKPLWDFFAVKGNRPDAQIAFLVSYPTILFDDASKRRNTDAMTDLSVPLAFQHYAYDALFEEEVPEIDLNRYKVICAFGVAATCPETVPALEKYVKAGGTLAVYGAAMNLNEYGIPLRNPLTDGLSFQSSANGKLGTVEKYGIPVKDSKYLGISGAWKSLAAVNGKTVLAERTYGKGKVYALSGEMQDYARAVLMKDIFTGIPKIAEIHSADGTKEIPNIEVVQASSGSLTAWYINNLNSTAKLLRFSVPGLAGMAAVDPLAGERYPVESGSVLVKADSAVRLILVAGPEADLLKRFGRLRTVSSEEMKKRYEEYRKQLRKTGRNIRKSRHVSIEKIANAGFDNAQKWVVDTAWKEDGKRDLKDVPFHENPFGDLRFEIIRFDYNENKTCIALNSKNSPDSPAEVRGIPLVGRFASVAFLLGGTHVKPGETFDICFNFEDGSNITVPVSAGKDFGSWMLEKNRAELNRQCVWKNSGNQGLFVFEWFNPEAAKPLTSFDLISHNGETVPVICAVTAVPSVYKRTYQHRIELKDAMPRVERPATMKWNGDILSSKTSFVWIFAPEGKRYPFPEERMKKAVVRFSAALEPDEFGKRINFNRLGMGVHGFRKGKRMKTHAKSWTYTDDTLSAFVKGKGITGKWIEVEIPLYRAACVDPNANPLDEIDSIFFSCIAAKAPIKIRFARIEYDD